MNLRLTLKDCRASALRQERSLTLPNETGRAYVVVCYFWPRSRSRLLSNIICSTWLCHLKAVFEFLAFSNKVHCFWLIDCKMYVLRFEELHNLPYLVNRSRWDGYSCRIIVFLSFPLYSLSLSDQDSTIRSVTNRRTLKINSLICTLVLKWQNCILDLEPRSTATSVVSWHTNSFCLSHGQLRILTTYYFLVAQKFNMIIDNLQCVIFCIKPKWPTKIAGETELLISIFFDLPSSTRKLICSK